MSTTHYQIRLTTVGPVHIGTGSKYGKKDYFLHDGSALVLDPAEFIKQLTPGQLTSYCEFLETDWRGDLEGFLRKSSLTEAALRAVKYRVNTPLARANRGDLQRSGVFEFIKDPYGCPYIPGSSFKGVLRTALFAAIVQANPEDFKKRYPSFDKWRRSKNADATMESHAFMREQPDQNDKNTVNDIMRFVSVSDSKPLTTGELVFAKKYDKFAEGDKAEHKRRMGNQSTGDISDGNELNIYRECLKPGTVVELRLSIDDRVNEYLPFALDAEGLARAFEQFDARYQACFLQHFEQTKKAEEASGVSSCEVSDDGKCRYIIESGSFAGSRCRNRAVGDTGYCNAHQDKAVEAASAAKTSLKPLTCYLGGGVDFDSKTILNALFTVEGERLYEISHILYEQFPTKIDTSFPKHRELWELIEDADFKPQGRSFNARGKTKKTKEDHRHWMDQDLGVSPHTMKLGVIGSGLPLPMGKCKLEITPLSNISHK